MFARFFSWIVFTLLFSCRCLQANPDVYLQVNLNSGFFGMFSVFSYVAGVLYEYDTRNYAGIKVDFRDLGLYYDPAYGSNWWEYYCEPICLGTPERSIIKNFTDDEYNRYAYFPLKYLQRAEVHQIIEKYIKIKPSIVTKVEQFFEDHLKDHYVISVHYRGTDKTVVEAPRVPYIRFIQQIRKHIKENEVTQYKIFAASDEERFIKFLAKAFPGCVSTYSTLRSKDQVPLHQKLANHYLMGEEALIDCLLLAKGDFLIRTTSNLSLWSTYFNPKIPVLELSKRYDEQ